VDVNAVTPDRETSARIANAMMEGYVAEQANARGLADAPSSGARLDILQSRLKSVEQRYETFRAQNLKPGGQTEKQVADLSAQVAPLKPKPSIAFLAYPDSAGEEDARWRRIPDLARSGGLGAAGYRYADTRRLELDLSGNPRPRHPDMISPGNGAKRRGHSISQSGAERSLISADLEQARSSVAQLKGVSKHPKRTWRYRAKRRRASRNWRMMSRQAAPPIRPFWRAHARRQRSTIRQFRTPGSSAAQSHRSSPAGRFPPGYC
jgi:hypothetical protein